MDLPDPPTIARSYEAASEAAATELMAKEIGLVAAGAGLVWMIRVFRGPRDEPPSWRARDG
jgi:hypothetical protein